MSYKLYSRKINKNVTIYIWGHAVVQLVQALRYKPEGRGFDSRWCVRVAALWPWGRLSH